MTISQAYDGYVKALRTIYEKKELSNIADWVFENITGVKRLHRITDKHKELDKACQKKLFEALEELLKHKPVQYILGEAWWYKMKLFVNEHVLIPRPETEELVEWVIQSYWQASDKPAIIDIGTGSGCIAIALKHELRGATITAIDNSAGALKVAAKNAADQNTGIQLIQLDFLNEHAWEQLPSFDVVVSNPPYIPESEKKVLKDNVAKFEPSVALFAPSADPFIFYRKIAAFAKQHLVEDGRIFTEIHEAFANEVLHIFSENGFNTHLKKDLYGKDRMIAAHR